MKVARAHCLFEQSGTFKNEFKKLGIPAWDYDILNDYGETDYQIDLFGQIEESFEGKESIFESFEKDDIVLAFFPCTRFEAKMPLLMRCQAPQQKNYSPTQKLEYSMKIGKEQGYNYQLWCKMFHLAYTKGLRMVVENPATQPHYLTTYFCERPSLVDKDRTERGNRMKKPTQYWFVNCQPEQNVIMEVLEEVEIRRHDFITGGNRTRKRSEIHPQYASRFIREFILDGGR